MGFVLGSTCGIGLGILLGWYNRLHDYCDVLINFMRSIPKTAMAPLFMVMFGFGDLPKVLLVSLACFFHTLITTIEGVNNVDALYIKSARSHGREQPPTPDHGDSAGGHAGHVHRAQAGRGHLPGGPGGGGDALGQRRAWGSCWNWPGGG